MKKYRPVFRTILLSALVICTGFRDRAAAIPPAYHVTDLGTLGGTFSQGLGINASGQVTGQSYTTGDAELHAYRYDGTMQDLGTLGGRESIGRGINDSGQVSGYSYTIGSDFSSSHAFLYDGTMHDLGTLGGSYSQGLGINASGQVTGNATTTRNAAGHAFLWTPSMPNGASGTMHDLGTLGGTSSVGLGINASGQVTGWSYTTGGNADHAYLWTPTTPNGVSGMMHDLGTLGGTTSYGWGINASGQVAGFSYMTGDDNRHAFLYDGTLHDLGTLGGTSSFGYGINASGQVTGYSFTTGNNAANHAFLYTTGSGMVDLNSLIDPLSGWELTSAWTINDAGQITGHGLIGGGGEQHAFLLTPVPEPASLALVVLGAAALAMCRVRRITSLLCLYCALSVTAAAHAAQYTVTDLGTLGGTFSQGQDINDSGQVTGESYTTGDAPHHAFLWTPTTPNGASGTLQNLGTLGGSYSAGFGINDSGQVTGQSHTTGDAATHAFVYNGTLNDLGTLGGTYSIGVGINDSGQVAGTSSTGIDLHAFLWTPTTPNGATGTMNDLGTFGGFNSFGLGINDSGQVAGWSHTTGNAAQHAFLYDGTMHDLGTLGGTYSVAYGINDSGQVAGASETIADSPTHAFLWKPTTPGSASGTMHDLGTLGGSASVGYGINDSGQVVGDAYTAGNAANHAFLYTSGSGMVDLNSLIDPLSGWELFTAKAINDAGQITGYGFNGSESHAFLLTPVPEPSTFALVALCAAAFAIRRSRRITNLLCLCCALSITAAANAATYTVSDLGTFGGIESFGSGLNASGQVSGTYRTTEDAEFHAFLWTPTTPNGATGTMIDLGTLGGPYSWGHGINASGQVTGNSDTTGDVAQHAILYDGTLHDLGTLGGTSSYAGGINDSGRVAGSSQTTGDSEYRAFLWTPATPGGTSGTMYDLGSLPGGSYSYGNDINADGQVTGYSETSGGTLSAFLWTPTMPNGASGTMHDLGTLGGTYCEAVGINDSGQVTGYSFIEGDEYEHAFLWTLTTPNGDSGTMLDLGTLGGLNSYAYHLGPGGQVVGYSEVEIEGFNYLHAFLYTSGDGMVDLNTLIDPLSGWELLDASDINDAGQITGQGLINDEYHAFLLTPVQIPGDFNANGVVDAADYTVWRDGLGSIYTQADYVVWKAHFGETSGSGSTGAAPAHAAAPEPSSLALSALCSLGLLICRRRRRDR